MERELEKGAKEKSENNRQNMRPTQDGKPQEETAQWVAINPSVEGVQGRRKRESSFGSDR